MLFVGCVVSILQIPAAVLDFYCFTFWSCLKCFTIARVAYFALNSLQLKLTRHKELTVVKTANSSAVKIGEKTSQNWAFSMAMRLFGSDFSHLDNVLSIYLYNFQWSYISVNTL